MAKYLIRLLVAVAIIAVLVWMGDGVAAHWEVMSQLSAAGLLLALVAVTLGRMLMAYKWKRLLEARGPGMPLRMTTQIYCSANVWGLFLPATIGPDAVRTVCACREGLRAQDVVASIIVERVIGFIIVAMTCVVAVLYFAEIAPLGTTLYLTGWLSALLLVGFALGLWLSMTQGIYALIHDRLLSRYADKKPLRILRELHGAYREYARHRRELGLFTLLTVVETVVTSAAFYIIAWGMQLDVGFVPVMAATFIANLASRLPLSLGGIGVFEGVFVLALALVGVPTTEALSVALLGQLLKILSWLPWWFTYTLSLGQFSIPTRTPGAP
ncbi:MAG: flippase-like domain-containing protein [Rhodobacteraceae bacterium]|nr:flippase-like domain-containing protein [Paracoccaceae bacterium]